MARRTECFLTKRDTDLTSDERILVNSWGSEAFGPQEWLRVFSWSTPDWRVFLLDNGTPVSHVKVTLRRGRIGSIEVLFGGVGGVMTPGVHQRKGFSSALLQLTREFIFSDLHVDYGLLFCLPELTHFYAGLGWMSVNSPVYIEQPQGKTVWPKAAMISCRDSNKWEDAEIDVCGRPW